MTERRFDPVSGTLTVRIPMRFVRHKGSKQIISPDGDGGEIADKAQTGPDRALLAALAKAWRWQKMLDSGRYGSLADLAAEEQVNPSTFSRYLRLLTLAPDLIAAVLNGDPQLDRQRLMEPFPEVWDEQPNAIR
jgi:hypothetical protein